MTMRFWCPLNLLRTARHLEISAESLRDFGIIRRHQLLSGANLPPFMAPLREAALISLTADADMQPSATDVHGRYLPPEHPTVDERGDREARMR